jgi:hypothetical protein
MIPFKVALFGFAAFFAVIALLDRLWARCGSILC